MTQIQQTVVVPDAVLDKLAEVRGRTLKVRVSTALVAALGVLLAAMAVAMLVDRLAILYDSRWRMVLTYSSLGVAAVTFGVWLLSAWRQSQQINLAASEVDQEMPQLEERWSTIAQLSTSPHASQVHPAMFRKVAQEAASWSPRVEPGQVVSLDRLVKSLWCLTAITVVLGLAVLLDSHRTSVLLRRFWSPGSPISATEFAEATGNVVVARGESLELAAQVEGSSVEQATLILEPVEGESQSVVLIPKGEDENRLSHRIRSVDSGLRYRLRAGDGQTPWYQVEVADRPKIEIVRMTIIPPAYAGQETKQFGKIPHKISTLKGSQLQLAIKPKASITSLELRLGGKLAENLKVDSQGWYRWETTLEESFALSPILTEQHGLTNRRPPVCEIECREDAPPVVKILKPKDQIAVLPNDTVPINFSAKDDVGIGSAELLVYDDSLAVEGEPLPLATIPIPLGDQQGNLEVQGSVDLDLSQFDLSNGSQLSFAVRVSEDRSALGKNDTPLVQGNPQESTNAATAQADERKPMDDVNKNSENDVATTADDHTQETKSVASNAAAPAKSSADSTDSKEQATAPANQQPAKEELANTSDSKADQETSPPPSEVASKDQNKESQETPASKGPAPTTNTAASPPASTDEANQQTDSDKVAVNNSSNSSPQPASDSPKEAPAESPESSDTASTPSMQTGQLEVPEAQSTASNRMQLTVDESATSLDGQRRLELELAIAPYLEEIDVALGKAQQVSRNVLDELETDPEWLAKHGRDINLAESQVADALNAVDKLQNRTRDTLYAFIGLQLVDISQAHIYPARQEFWKALQAEGDSRIESVRTGWQQTGRARDLLERLTGQFERARQDYALADTVEKIKKMYQIYVENSLAMMREANDSSPYSRKRAEFDLDDEYLARLKEVLEMRSEMRAELARILADDPRLLRRFLDAQRNRTKVLRNELADLTDRQGAMNRKTKAWEVVEEESRPNLASILLQRHVKGIEEIAMSAADLHDRFETWLPLNRDSEDADLLATGKLLQQIATSTQEVSASAGSFAGKKTGVSPTVKPEDAAATESEGTSPAEEKETLDAIVSEAEQLYGQFNRLEVLLSQLGMRDDQVEIAGFAANRLVETRRLVEKTSAWIRQLQYHQAGEFHRAAEIEQYQLAMATDTLAGKFANLEQDLSATLRIEDDTLPEPIAEKARGLLAALDQQAAPNQLAAVYGLRRNQMPRAVSRQQAALKALELAENEYDEMIQLVIVELDKFPVQDPIASLLDDPTLDELLRELEQEIPLNELLGIPARPTNLRIMDDWLRGDMGEGAMGYNANQVLMNKLREDQLQRQRAIEKAYRTALARAMKESEAEGVVVDPAAPARATVDWNKLASRLGDDLQQGRNTAPPERYRQAIEQYFRQISGASDEKSAAK